MGALQIRTASRELKSGWRVGRMRACARPLGGPWGRFGLPRVNANGERELGERRGERDAVVADRRRGPE